MTSFFEELKRRNVIRVGVAYVVAAWLLAQVVELAAESFGAPDWVMKMVIVLLIIGLLPTLFFSWAFELTPDGLRRETQVQPDQSLTQHTARKLDYMTMALLIGAIGFMVLDRFVLEPRVPALVPEAPSTAEDSPAASPAAEEDIEANSIAVLPFVNMSNDPEQEYFSDGISEELLNLLARVDGVTVASRTSSFAYKGQTTAIPEIARDLKVANVLEGSVRKSGDQIRITAQLIDTRNDRHLWSDAFDRELTDIFVIQDEIANAIVNALRTELGLEQVAKDFTVTATTENLDAYEIYLKARGLMLARVELAESVRLFEQAVALDPQFAGAWAGLGAAAWIAPSWSVTDRDYLAISRKATEKALELDENQSMAWAVLSGLRDFDETGPDYETSLNYLDKALQIDPKNTTAWLWRAIAWSELGFHERALKDLEQCLELDPAYQNCRLHLTTQNIMLNRHDRVRDLSIHLLRAGFGAAMSAHIPYLVRRGELLGAAMLVFNLSRHPDFPGEEWLNALQHPEQDHSLAIAKTERWLRTDDTARIPIKLDLMLAFGGYDHIDTSERHNWNRIWQAGFPGFHESGQFKRLANERGLTVYWRKHGFPPQCRPLGDKDFECDWFF